MFTLLKCITLLSHYSFFNKLLGVILNIKNGSSAHVPEPQNNIIATFDSVDFW